MTRETKLNSPFPKHCRHGDCFRRFLKTRNNPSNRTLVRVLRLGGAKRRFILAAAKHSCGACGAQKRPDGPIVSRSPNSFVFNEVVGLDLFFLNTYEKHTLLAMNIVLLGVLDCSVSFPCGDQSGETLRNAHRNYWLWSYGRPRIFVVDQPRILCSGIFAEKVESDGTRLEVTPLEAPWRNGKTERAGQGLEGRLQQDDTGRPRSTDMDRF